MANRVDGIVRSSPQDGFYMFTTRLVLPIEKCRDWTIYNREISGVVL